MLPAEHKPWALHTIGASLCTWTWELGALHLKSEVQLHEYKCGTYKANILCLSCRPSKAHAHF